MKRFYSILPWLLLALTATALVKVKKGFPEPVPKRAVLNQPSAKVSVLSESQETGVECYAATQVDADNAPGIIHFYSGDTNNRTKIFCVSDEASDPTNSRTMLGGTLYKDPSTNEVSYVGYEVIKYDMGWGAWPERWFKVDVATGDTVTLSREIKNLKWRWFTVEAACQNPVTGELWGMCRNDSMSIYNAEYETQELVSRVGRIMPDNGEFDEMAKLEHYYMGMAFDAKGQMWAIRPIFGSVVDEEGVEWLIIEGSIICRLDMENNFAELDAIQLTTAADGSSRPFLMWWYNSISFDYNTGNLYALLCEYNDYGYCYQYMYRIDTQTGELKHPATGESGPGAYLNDICYGLAIPLPSIDCTVGAAGVGTLILPFAAELPKDMQAYRCTGVDGTRVLTQAVDEIPANVPLLITALPGTYQFTGVPEGSERSYTDGMLTGVMEETVITSGYVLQQQDAVAFYPVTAGKPITVPAYKCYLSYTGEQQAMRLDDVLTGLKGVTTSEDGATLYDLQGRRTRTATAPGVYIQNNRKIVKSKK